MEIESTDAPQEALPAKLQLVTAYRESGLSVRAFARQQGLSRSTLHRWVCEGRSQRSPDNQGTLLEVPNLLTAPESQPTYRLQLGPELVLEVTSGFKVEELRVLLQLLQGL
jgi:transposase-like protein